ncbi:MAG TPA: hypothetical protein VGO31_02225 [Microbacteriaceae bacterium]|jgi:hypothetical protein|nr:hypothetical protein [Microbacteriaceae bacterium]
MNRAVDVGVLARGFHEALGRFKIVDVSDAEAAFLPMFEMLNWATAIDERCSRDFAPDGTDHLPGKGWEQRLVGREVVRGLRFARNVVHHEWAEAVEWRPAGPGWVWRQAADLRSRRTPGREHYERDLAAKLVVRVSYLPCKRSWLV